MSKVYETLKKKNDTSVEVYPNIERQNIPDGAINGDKIEDASVTTDKIVDGAITDAKLDATLKQQSDDFGSIYDSENEQISVQSVIASEQIECDRLYVTNDIDVEDINASGNITSNGYYDAQNDELKVIVNHCIQAKLVNRNDISDERWIHMFFVSSTKTSITTFSELLSELNKRINMTILDNANNTLGWVESVDINNGYVSLYVSDGNGDVESVEFNSAITIQDAVYPV